MKKDNVELMTLSNFFDEYLRIECALTFFSDGLMNLDEMTTFSCAGLSNASSALSVIIQQLNKINDALDLKSRDES